MPDFGSNHGQILLALKKRVQDLQPREITYEEVEVRDDWRLASGEPIRGITIYPAGESSRDGTVGTQDIGYLCGIAFVKFREGDAILASDNLMAWREAVRRELSGARLSVTIVNASDPLEHVCLISEAGKNISRKEYPSYWINHLTIAVWLRELGT